MTTGIIKTYRRVFRVKNELPDYVVVVHPESIGSRFAFLLLLTGFLCVVLLGMVRYGWFGTAASMKAGGALFAQTDGAMKVWDALSDRTDGATKVWDALSDRTEGAMKVFAPLSDRINAPKKSEYAVI